MNNTNESNQSNQSAEFNVIKLNQGNRDFHIARMPQNFKSFPIRYLEKRKAKGDLQQQSDFQELDIKDRGLVLKKFKVFNEREKDKTKREKTQFILEDPFDVPEKAPKDSFAKYNGIETKAENYYLFIKRRNNLIEMP